MDVEEAIINRRTIRRYKQEEIPIDILKKLINSGRLAPAGMNYQAIEYIIVRLKEMRDKVFPYLSWAGALPPSERTPELNRQPTAYIIVLWNKDIKNKSLADIGAAIENILLTAIKYGLGSCWMGSINREKIREIFKIPSNYDIAYIISLGYPDEKSRIEPYSGSFNYWKDEKGMHVPKRSLDDVIFKIY